MTILILTNSAKGMLLFRKQLLVRFLSLGYEIAVSSPDGEGLDELGIKHYPTPISRRGKDPIKDIRLFRRYCKLISEVSPSAVLTYTVKPNVYGGLAAKIKHIPYFISVTGLGTGFETSQFLRFLLVSLYRISAINAKFIFFQNYEDKAIFKRFRIGLRCEQYVTNGSGVDFSKYSFLPLKNKEKTEFLFSGRIMKEKGIYELLEAGRRLFDKNLPFIITIIGKKEENITLPTNEYLHYEGEKSDVIGNIERADCVVLPSYHEGMSNALLEGAACGRPLIATDIPGAREVIRDGLNGYLVKKADAADLAAKMERFILLPADTKAEMGKNSNRIAKENFDRRIVTEAVSGRIHAFLTAEASAARRKKEGENVY